MHKTFAQCLQCIVYCPVTWITSHTCCHYNDVIMTTMASQITSLMIVYSIVYSDADQSKHQRSASLAFVRGIHRGPVISPHKWPVTRKMFPFDDVIMGDSTVGSTCSDQQRSKHTGKTGIHQSPVVSPRKGPVIREVCSRNDVTMVHAS